MAAPLEHHDEPVPITGVVAACRVDEAGSVITVAGPQGRQSFRLPVRPDLAASRALARSWRRVDRVVVTVAAERMNAQVAGTGHRLPRVARIPVAVALGLAASGVPTTVRVSDR